MQDIWNRIYSLVNVKALINKIALQLPDLIVAAVTLIFFYVLWKILKKGMGIFIAKSKLDLTASNFLQTVLKYTILTIGIITSLGQMGINITSILTSLGILGLTIGFAAKDALSNIISGIFIFWDRPFVINDLVEIEGEYGRVDQITLRSTRIVTVDGKMLAIPNNTVVNQIVSSYTNFPHLRIEVAVTVGVEENLVRIRKLLLNLIENDGSFMKEPKPEVVVEELNDYNILLKVKAWIDDERNHIAKRYELREKVFETLREANVNMPYETIQLAPFSAKAEIKNN